MKDTYFQIPIWQQDWWFLRFGFEGKVFKFGISLAPQTFTRCMDAVLAPMMLL